MSPIRNIAFIATVATLLTVSTVASEAVFLSLDRILQTDPAVVDNSTTPSNTTDDNTTLPTPPPSPEENFPEYTCFRCVYLDLFFDDRGCFRNNASRLNDMTAKTFADCVTRGE